MNSISREAEISLEIKSSRFIGRTFRAASPEEAMAVIKRVKADHQDATHNCWAYRVGRTGEQARYNDDGEPQGTAGPPILQVLERRNLTHTIIVVTRYFGGIKLGTGGLVRAYGEAAKMVVEESLPREIRLMKTIKAAVPHAALAPFENYLLKRGFEIVGREFGEIVTLGLRVPAENEPDFRSAHARLVNGKYLCEVTGEEFI